jgi:hypothetical protein
MAHDFLVMDALPQGSVFCGSCFAARPEALNTHAAQNGTRGLMVVHYSAQSERALQRLPNLACAGAQLGSSSVIDKTMYMRLE